MVLTVSSQPVGLSAVLIEAGDTLRKSQLRGDAGGVVGGDLPHAEVAPGWRPPATCPPVTEVTSFHGGENRSSLHDFKREFKPSGNQRSQDGGSAV